MSKYKMGKVTEYILPFNKDTLYVTVKKTLAPANTPIVDLVRNKLCGRLI